MKSIMEIQLNVGYVMNVNIEEHFDENG